MDNDITLLVARKILANKLMFGDESQIEAGRLVELYESIIARPGIFDKRKKKCDSCGGTGECSACRCGNPHDCGECDGTGKIDETVTRAKLQRMTRAQLLAVLGLAGGC